MAANMPLAAAKGQTKMGTQRQEPETVETLNKETFGLEVMSWSKPYWWMLMAHVSSWYTGWSRLHMTRLCDDCMTLSIFPSWIGMLRLVFVSTCTALYSPADKYQIMHAASINNCSWLGYNRLFSNKVRDHYSSFNVKVNSFPQPGESVALCRTGSCRQLPEDTLAGWVSMMRILGSMTTDTKNIWMLIPPYMIILYNSKYTLEVEAQAKWRYSNKDPRLDKQPFEERSKLRIPNCRFFLFKIFNVLFPQSSYAKWDWNRETPAQESILNQTFLLWLCQVDPSSGKQYKVPRWSKMIQGAFGVSM